MDIASRHEVISSEPPSYCQGSGTFVCVLNPLFELVGEQQPMKLCSIYCTAAHSTFIRRSGISWLDVPGADFSSKRLNTLDNVALKVGQCLASARKNIKAVRYYGNFFLDFCDNIVLV